MKRNHQKHNPLITKMEEAIELVIQAQELVDEVMAEINGQPESHYESYGKYGFNQLLNNGNQYDEGLEDIIKLIKDRM
jgi:hypothetical protein